MMLRNGVAMKEAKGKMAVAQVVKGFKKFYEGICHGDLREKLSKHQFSRTLSRVITTAYAMKRRICV